MASNDTDLSRMNAAAANEGDADDVHSFNIAKNPSDNSGGTPMSLFGVESEDEFDDVIAVLSTGPGVAAHVTAAWDRNRWYRVSQGIDAEMTQSLNRRKGIYSARQQAIIDTLKGCSSYPRMIDTLCRNGSAYVMECFMSVERPEKLVIKGDVELTREQRRNLVEQSKRLWVQKSVEQQRPLSTDETVELVLAIEADAKAKLSRQAQAAAHCMEDVVYGQFGEGGWETAFAQCIDDAITLKKGVIYGPYAAITTATTFRRDRRGKLSPFNKPRYIYKWAGRSPFDIFPQAGTRSFLDGDLVDRDRFTAATLLGMKGKPGWRDDAIDRVVRDYAYSGYPYWTSFDNSRAFAEKRGSTILRNYGFIEYLRYYGHVTGDRLMATGLSDDTRHVKSSLMYHINAIVVGSEVLYLTVLDERIDFRPYAGVSFAPDIGGFWGEGFGEVSASEDAKQAAAERATIDNAGYCSRPSGMVDEKQIVPGQTLGATYPGRMWLVNAREGATTKPVEYFKIDGHIAELDTMKDGAEKAACERVGLPYPDMGTKRAAGAGRTASGFAEIVQNMTRPQADFIYRIERDVVRPNFKNLVLLNNMYYEDDSIKTTADIEPQGLFAELSRLANAERKLAMYDRVKTDPLVSHKHRAVLIRSIGDDQGIPDGALPSDQDAERLQKQQDAAQQAQQAAQAGQPQEQAQPAQPEQPAPQTAAPGGA